MNEWQKLKADTHREFGLFKISYLLIGLLTRRTYRPVVTMRLCRIVRSWGMLGRLTLPLAKFLHRIACQLGGMDLPSELDADAGLKITHGWGLVVSPRAKIGSNVTLFHGATIGQRNISVADGSHLRGYPTIERDVWIGPHALIIGPVNIGHGSRIAGGSFVFENIPALSVVAGNPSRILRSSCIPDVSNPAPVHSEG